MAKTLLIVEDDPFVQRFYERLFKLHEYTVELAKNGAEALTKVRSLKPSLVLLDIMMPGMDGLQVLAKLNSDPETKDLLVIMLTNFDDEELATKAVQLGAVDFIVKSSVSDDQLLAVVDKYIKVSDKTGTS